MKKCILVLLFSVTTLLSFANHTKGGWLYYEYLGPGDDPGRAKYRITLKLYTNCILNSGQFDPTISFTIFNTVTRAQLYNISVSNNGFEDITNCSTPECYPCIQRIPSICYKIITYSTVRDLPIIADGYTISYQRCCRIAGIVNIQDPSNAIGETWTVNIPGAAIPNAYMNSSAKFSQNDTAIICSGSSFKFDFSATDINGDSLVYDFTPAYVGGNSGAGGAAPNPATQPPYASAPYAAGFAGSSPMGGGVVIDRTTGIVSGIAPASGVYVLTVTVSEYNKTTRTKIAEVRKSLHIEVADCNITEAVLKPVYTSCQAVTGYIVAFKNLGSSVNIETYDWEFGDGNTSTLPEPVHTYAAAGDYTLKLVVNRGKACSDSTTSIVKVYPGFDPDFEIKGKCTNVPIQFNDLTTTAFPTVNFWSWNFGDFSSPNNTSSLQFPTHTYTTAGEYEIVFVVATDKGCIDTLRQKLEVLDSPPLEVSNDTLICTVDTLQIFANGIGTVLWSPNYMISDVNSPTPLVSPDVTTKYHVLLTDPFGCTGQDSVNVRVVDHVTQSLKPDTTICQTDPIVLNLISDALYFTWTPNDGTISDPGIRTPTVQPLTTTTYHVVGAISNKCFAVNDIEVKVVPYPVPNAGPDIPVCIGFSTQLHASGGAYYSWSPALFLSATNIPDPKVNNPTSGVRYIVSVRDTLGCPKTVRDTVLVNVITIHADAGPADTSVVLGQPLLLNATGGTHFLWEPDRWLSNINVHDPISLPQDNIRYKVTVSDDNGCKGVDSIYVRLYRLAAGLYIPNAFTPNNDGLNDYFQPIELGLKTLDLFRIFNRWGELLYSSTDMKRGWDGKYKGRGQDPGTYVWYAEGTDYTGKKVSLKGTVILLRE